MACSNCWKINSTLDDALIASNRLPKLVEYSNFSQPNYYLKTRHEDESFLHCVLTICFAVLSVWTVVSSVLVCLVNLRQKGMLRISYNRHIFHLAIADLLTSTMIGITPGFVIAKILPAPNEEYAGELHCRLVLSHFLIFTFCTSSILISSSLALERWYAVVKPFQYRTRFHVRRLVCEAIVIWSFSIVLNSSLPFELFYDATKPLYQRCNISWRHFSTAETRRILSIVQFLGKFLIPLFLTCVLYIHLFRKTHASRSLSYGEGIKKRNRICRMSAASTIALAICWFPNQVYYALYKFDLVELNTNVHHLTIAFAMINGCLNPFIFAFHSEQYRNGFKRLLGCRKDGFLARAGWKRQGRRQCDVIPTEHPLCDMRVFTVLQSPQLRNGPLEK